MAGAGGVVRLPHERASQTTDLVADWSPVEWQLYLDGVPRPVTVATCRALDDRFGLTAGTNHDVLAAWFGLALDAGDATVLPRVEQVLLHVGRMKYLRPLYTTLAANPTTRAFATDVYARARAGSSRS